MDKRRKTLVLLSPVFNVYEQENWMPWQAVWVRTVNELFPELKIVIVAFHFPAAEKKKIDWHGNDVYLLGGALKKKWHTALRWAQAWQLLKRISRKNDIAGILSFFCSECAFIGHYFAKRHHLQHKIWVLGQDAKKDNKQVSRIHPAGEELVCLSDFLRDEFYRNHNILPAHVVAVGANTSLFSGGTHHRDTDLLGAGSLTPLKQYDVFIDVVKLVHDQLPAVKAVICGDGEERERLIQKINTLGLGTNVSLPGYQPHEATLSRMQRSKLFLHTSLYEGLGVVMLEALYAGAHVISFVKPLYAPIPNWHVVQTKEEMAAKALWLLRDEATAFRPVLAYPVQDAARGIAKLFGIES